MKVVLIACSKTKASGRMAAKDLYQGALFKKSWEYAKSIIDPEKDRIYILSAKHHLLHPDDLIETYDTTLVGKKTDYVKEWAEIVKQQMIEVGLDLENDVFVILAGETYCKCLLKGAIKDYLANYERPLKGLRQGEQMHKLNQLI